MIKIEKQYKNTRSYFWSGCFGVQGVLFLSWRMLLLECKECYFFRGGCNYFFVEVFTSCAEDIIISLRMVLFLALWVLLFWGTG